MISSTRTTHDIGHVTGTAERGLPQSCQIRCQNNFHITAIAMSPVISKLLLTLCDHVLTSDPLQFSSKPCTGCADFVCTLKPTTEYFVNRGSSVYVASLGISKAFDRVHHYKLFRLLLMAGVLQWLLICFMIGAVSYFFKVRWNNKFSVEYPVGSGVRQGDCLSPAIFNVFINAFIIQLRSSGTGCHLSSLFLGCSLYADEIILVCPSISCLQAMLDKCTYVANVLSLQFNINKCHCIAIGKMHSIDKTPVILCGFSVS
jgi:Reverse transcriptase (RNA-dependent DNA polymerase)